MTIVLIALGYVVFVALVVVVLSASTRADETADRQFAELARAERPAPARRGRFEREPAAAKERVR
jgi:hypothetical protein